MANKILHETHSPALRELKRGVAGIREREPVNAVTLGRELDKRMLELIGSLREHGEDARMHAQSLRMDAESRATKTEKAFATLTQVLHQAERRVRDVVAHSYDQVEALFALYGELDPQTPLPPFRGWAVSPDLAAHLMRLVRVARPDFAVDVGSGLSTVVTGLVMRKIGHGHVVAIEHDLIYAEATAELLQRFGAEDHASVIHAPLVNIELAGEQWRWYDMTAVELKSPIDLLVIDGPPQATGPLARYPALPLLAQYFSPDAIVILDDAARHDEAEIVDRWLSEFPDFRVEMLKHEKGTAQLRRMR